MLPIPSTGRIALAIQKPLNTKGNRNVRHIWIDVDDVRSGSQDLIDALDRCAEENERGSDIYFTTGSFSGDLDDWSGRKGANVVGQRSLFLDIDCAKWGIDASTTGFEGLLGWLEHDPRVLVPSLVVCSGGGLHVYWIADQDIPLDRWHAAADRLRNGAAEVFFQAIDKQCTIDRARILRVPGFVNHKYPAAVEMMWPTEGNDQPIYTVEELEAMVAEWPRTASQLSSATSLASLEALGLHASGSAPMPKAASAFADAEKSDPASWDRMASAARSGEGCEVLAQAMLDNAGVSYSEWCGLLTVVNCTDNVEAGILAISADHPDWGDTQDTGSALAKAESFGGPRRCSTFAAESPLCQGCRHRGRITSPVEIGRPHVRLETATVQVQVPAPAPAPTRPAPSGSAFSLGSLETAPPARPTKTVTLPEPPRGYLYMHQGVPGTYAVAARGDSPGEEDIIRLWDTPVYTSADLAIDGKGKAVGYITWIGARPDQRVMFDHSLMQPAELINMLSALDTAGCKHRLEGPPQMVTAMITPFLAQLTRGLNIKPADLIDNFGPATAADTESFALGGVRYRADGTESRVVVSDVLAHTKIVAAGMAPEIPEDAERIRLEWNAYLSELHSGHDRAYDRMLVAMGFGAILPQFIEDAGHRGLLILLTSDNGASRKTSSVQNALSIYTRELAALTVNKTTVAGALARQHSACGVPVLLDDFWGNDREDEAIQKVKSMAIGITGGGTRAKGNRDAGGFISTWTFMTGNKDVTADIGAADGAAEGALRRIFSIPVPPAAATLAARDRYSEFTRWCSRNGGVIGHLWVKHVVAHQEELLARREYWSGRLRSACSVASEIKYEFVRAAALSTLIGCEAAGALGLHPYDTEDVLATLAKFITQSWKRMQDNVIQDDSILEAMLTKLRPHTITANRIRSGNFGSNEMPPGAGVLYARRYPDEGKIFISDAGVNAICRGMRISPARGADDLSSRGAVHTMCDLGEGTSQTGVLQSGWLIKLPTLVTTQENV